MASRDAQAIRTKPQSAFRTVLLALLVQTAVVAAGWLTTFYAVRSRAAAAVEERAREQNVRTAQGLAEAVAALSPTELNYGTDAWSKAQKLVENVNLLGGAFVCILDSSGRILCHPDLRRNPALREVAITPGAGREAIDPRLDPTRSGLLLDGTHYLAVRKLGETGNTLLVHQPQDGLASLGREATTGVLFGVFVVGMAVLAITGFASFILIRRHQRVLEGINKGLEDEVRLRVRQSLEGRHAIIFGLAKLADLRDSETGQHLDRICAYSQILAHEVAGLDPTINEDWISDLRLAAALHDIGKVGVPDSILLKQGKLSPEERRVLEQHPLIGSDTLIELRKRMGDDRLLTIGIQVTLSHHERWDGTGYPYGLSGEQIPLAARIVAICDVYDALTSERVYKAAIPHERACRMIGDQRGKHFDPAIVDAFMRICDQFDALRAQTQAALAAEAGERAAA